MKVNRKRSGAHHLPCLSGISQSPLIADNGSERSTQITAHSLSLRSPTIITSHQQQHSQPHQAVPICTTPQLQHSSASVNLLGSKFSFPPLPPRTNTSKSQQLMFEITNTRTNGNNANDVDKSPKDLNMNGHHERNREPSHHMISPSNVRTLGPSATPSSVPPDVFSGFFPESQQTFVQQQQQLQQSRRVSTTQPPTPSSTATSDSPPDSSINNSTNHWPQQEPDDNYHLYHEPMDPDDQIESTTTDSCSKNESANPRSIQLIKLDNVIQPPPPPRPRSNLSAISTVARDWLTKSPSASSEVSPSFRQNGPEDNTHHHQSSSFAERSNGMRNDISADIYHNYVTLKSRPYNNTKNATTNSASNNSTTSTDIQRNPTSTVESQISPTVSGHPMMPFHFRDHCLRELIETESNYVHALEMIIVRFAKPLEVLLRRDDNQLIFGHIRYFHHVHSVFQDNLFKAALRLYNKDLPKIPSPKRTTTDSPSTPILIGKDLTNPSPLPSPKDLLNLQAHLSAKTSQETNLKISTCFLNMKEKLLKYGEYCATLSRAQAVLDELTSKNEAIAARLDRCQQEANEGKFKLRDLLSLPMQRILKYHLLLSQLIKNTSSSNDDYQGLKRAHEAMVDLGQYINEVKRDTEAIQIINDIESSIVGLNMPSDTRLTDYGRLVMDGFIRIKVPHDSKPKLKLPNDTKLKQKRYVFIFDKVMLITLCKTSVGVRYQYRDKSNSTYHYKEALVFSEYELDINPRNASMETLTKHTTKDKWAFNFNLTRSSDKSVYSFYLKSQEMKSKWIEAIQKAMDNTRPSVCRNNGASHKFLMHTFNKASCCDHCGKLLLGLYYQGYQCRNCLMSVHKRCLAGVRACGPALPPKLANSALSQSQRVRNNEPASPSMRSNYSDHDNVLLNPASNSSSVHCMEAAVKNEYSNLMRGMDGTGISASFRENSSRVNPMVNQRPVSSMVDVSLQNSTNHLAQQRRLLSGSVSTPVINRDAWPRARAIIDYQGDEKNGELNVMTGDLIIIEKELSQNSTGLEDKLEGKFSDLKINGNSNHGPLYYGKNTRTHREGRFPGHVVQILPDHSDLGCFNQDENNQDFMLLSDGNNENINFTFKDQPWFCGRTTSAQARQLLENTPYETFLVRSSLKHNGSYVISINHSSGVKHIRIHVSQDGSKVFIGPQRYFRSVIDLVSWYEQNSLVESFPGFDARLSRPFKMVDHFSQDLAVIN